jgi:TolA-binding protein
MELFVAERYAEAAVQFEQLRVHGDGTRFDDATYYLARCRFAQLDMVGAEQLFRLLLARDPYSPFRGTGTYYLGRTRLEQGDPTEALALFQEAVQLDPRSADVDNARYFIGRSHYELGRLSEAADLLNAFEQGYPESIWVDDARYFLGRSYYDREDYASALGPLERVLLTPGAELADNARYYVACVDYKLGQLPLALTRFQELVAQHPQSLFADDALYYQTRIHVQEQQCAAARSSYEQLRTQYPESPELTRTLEVLSAGGC